MSKPPVVEPPILVRAPGAEHLTAARRGSPWALVTVACSVIAAAIAAYLTWTVVSHTGPLGCGSGSGCEEVLSSRWAKVLGVPVSALAVAVYIALAAVGGYAYRRPAHVGCNVLLAVLAGTVLASAAWFVSVQLWLLGRICPWCLADHTLGSLAAVSGLLAVGQPAIANRFRIRPFGLAVGIVLAIVLAGLQWWVEPSGPPAGRLAGDRAGVVGSGAGRTVRLLQGKFELPLDQIPRVGSEQAPHLVVKFFDYCCPHCRAAHQYLMEIMDEYPGQFMVLKVPVPLNPRCNAAWTENDPRFAQSCELAKLALAVWYADSDKFAAMDRWLFESPQPRTLAEAQVYAARLLGTAGPPETTDPMIGTVLRQSTQAFGSLPDRKLPLLFSPEFATVVGRPSSKQELQDILDQSWHLSSPPPPTQLP